MRVVGLDLGTRRVGVAVSDSAGAVATPHTVVMRSDDPAADRAAVAALAVDVGAERIVVGLPLSMDGTVGPAAVAAQAEAEALATATGLPVDLHDERLTTVAVSRVPGRRTKRRRPVVDDAAAAVILQSWLDANRVHKTA